MILWWRNFERFQPDFLGLSQFSKLDILLAGYLNAAGVSLKLRAFAIGNGFPLFLFLFCIHTLKNSDLKRSNPSISSLIKFWFRTVNSAWISVVTTFTFNAFRSMQRVAETEVQRYLPKGYITSWPDNSLIFILSRIKNVKINIILTKFKFFCLLCRFISCHLSL